MTNVSYIASVVSMIATVAVALAIVPFQGEDYVKLRARIAFPLVATCFLSMVVVLALFLILAEPLNVISPTYALCVMLLMLAFTLVGYGFSIVSWGSLEAVHHSKKTVSVESSSGLSKPDLATSGQDDRGDSTVNQPEVTLLPSKVQVLLTVLKDNNTHVRHNETIRMIFLPAVSAIFYAIVVALPGDIPRLFRLAGVILLFVVSISGFLFSLKAEAVVNTFLKRNTQVIAELEKLTSLKLQHVAAYRVAHGPWRYIRFRYLVPVFYLCLVVLSAWVAMFFLDP
ncbi:hypothetical protein MUP07_02645 [Candidatus Bathyarchaeota archaeon]|nr:hypothetical protein [Candidatus Bathyarchaeota archaeon]